MLASQLSPQLQCHTCRPQQKLQRGCNAPPKYPLVLDGQNLDRCPMRGFYEDPVGYNDLFQRYRWLKEGQLCDPGLVPDQAAPFIECVKIITLASDQAQDQIRKKQEAERRAEARKKPAVPKTTRRPARGGRGPRR